MSTLHRRPPPHHVNIYTEGCSLVKGKENPMVTSGCGIVIVKDGVKRSFMTASASLQSFGSEYDAILHALRSVHEAEWATTPPPSVTLHTDQLRLVRAVAPLVYGVTNPNMPKDFPKEATQLLKEMRVELHHTKGRRISVDSGEHRRCFVEAHELASAAAWKSRLEKQGYIYMRGEGRLEGDQALAYIHRTMCMTKPLVDR